MITTSRAVRLATMCLVGAACWRSTTAEGTPPSAQSEWTRSLNQSWQEVGAGRYVIADRLLADFASRYPATTEAIDALYWRAVYKLDPANPAFGPHDAAALLDAYLISGQTLHGAEAQALRRVAGALESRFAASAAASNGSPAAPKDDKAQGEEIVRLKDELAKANAELERIKRRLAQPKP